MREILTGLAVLGAIGLTQSAWAQHQDPDIQAGSTDHSAHAAHGSNDNAASVSDSGQVFDSSQLSEQNQSQGRGQGGMMRQNGQGGDQGNGMQRRQGQGGMMRQHDQDGSHDDAMQGGDRMQRMQRMRMRMAADRNASTVGQDAFSAIRAVVTQLEENQQTDWSTIDIDALRDHLIDMHEVTLNATVETTEVDGGASYRVTGTGRTLEAIRKMVPTHAYQLTGETQWTSVAAEIRNGVRVTVTADNEEQVARIRALGFMGFMVSGEHHETHHLAIVGADADSMSDSTAGGGHDH